MEATCRRALVLYLLLLGLGLVLSSTAFATTYYVDSAGGNDTNNGTTQPTAWQSLTKVNTITFAAGDQILLKCGSVWNGQQLWPKGSGSSGNPIVVNTYSTGAKPIVNGQAAFQEAVKLYNQQYWEINNLEVTNTGGAAGVRQGVRVQGTNAGTLNHIYLKTLTIHDVNGSLTTGENSGKTNGGILYDADGTTATNYNDVLIDGCNVYHVDRTAINIWSGWARCAGSTWHPHTSVVVRNNTVDDIGGDGIVPSFCVAPLIEYNVSSHSNARSANVNASIWTWGCDDAVMQYNESYATYIGGGDGQGFDIDAFQNRGIVQYNYSHDNAGGFLLICGCPAAAGRFNDGAIARYNISQNDRTRAIYCWDVVTNVSIYNNTIYIGSSAGNPTIFAHAGEGASVPNGVTYNNNIIYNLGSGGYTSGGTNLVYDYNLFYGNHPASEPSDAHKLTSNPLLVNPGSGGTGRSTVDGYKLQAGSPCRDSGKTISGNGGKDYWSNTVPYNGSADRGAHEYQGGGGSPPVANFTGNPTSGAAPLTVAFTDTSTNSPTSWSWTFGDGGTSTAQSPSHTYTSAGTYTVALTATNAYGSNTNTKTNYITVTSGGGWSANLLTNPGFESGVTGWTCACNSSAVANNAHSGTYSMRVGKAAGIRAQIISSPSANTLYKVGGWGKITNAPEPGATIGVEVRDGAGTPFRYYVTFTTTSYQYQEIQFTTPSTVSYMHVYLWKDAGNGYLYGDDVILQRWQ